MKMKIKYSDKKKKMEVVGRSQIINRISGRNKKREKDRYRE